MRLRAYSYYSVNQRNNNSSFYAGRVVGGKYKYLSLCVGFDEIINSDRFHTHPQNHVVQSNRLIENQYI